MNKTIAVTGSSGFIGKNVCISLRRNGYNVVEIDSERGFDIRVINNFSSLPDYDVIVHLAARSFVPDSFKEPLDFYQTNINGTLNVLESARQKKANVIFFSSYLYGTPKYLPVDENHELRPHNPYANSKLIGEKLCEAYFNDFNLSTTVFRPFNIYGNDQNGNFLIPTILSQLENEEVHLLDSIPKRDYIHVSDVVSAISCAIDANLNGYECFNLGSGKSFSVEHIAKALMEISKSEANLVFSNSARKSEVLDCYADITKTVEMLNWKPQVSIKQGLEQIINGRK